MPHEHTTIGWDVGGAHLKAALVDGKGIALSVVQVVCPLWRGLDQLERAIDEALLKLDCQVNQHAITMTGELADIFPDRHTGVIQITDLMNTRLHGEKRFYAGQHGFVAHADVMEHTNSIASANWLASATYLAGEVNQGLFVDIGSTTADFVMLANGKPQPRGYSDAERMQHEELVYTGVIRTPLMALGSRVPFAGEWQLLAAEHFATTADVYRLTGDLLEADDMGDTADGADKTREASARRLARMIGRDLNDGSMPAWIGLARVFKQMQLRLLENAALRCISCQPKDFRAPVIGAGMGDFLARLLARRLGRRYYDITCLLSAINDETREMAGICFPAYAVTCIALKEPL